MYERCDDENDAQLDETGDKRPKRKNAPSDLPDQDAAPFGEGVGTEEVGSGPSSPIS
jgi:hypothetical protein